MSPPFHCGTVAIVGSANVGKSTLLNCILGEKVSITSPIAQTTRNLIRGVLTDERGQLVMMDTPGMHKARGDLGRLMNNRARSSADGADVVLLVLDGSRPPREEDEGWMQRLCGGDAPCVIALNKADIDTRAEELCRAAWERARAAKSPDATRKTPFFTISAMKGEGVPALVEQLFALLPEGPLLFPEDMLSDFPRKLAIADIIREKLFALLEEELPHAVAVFVDTLDEREDAWVIQADIYVNKPSQKGIVIGNKGRLLARAKRAAEAELSALYEKEVKLDLWVKVQEDWSRNYWLLKKLGYV